MRAAFVLALLLAVPAGLAGSPKYSDDYAEVTMRDYVLSFPVYPHVQDVCFTIRNTGTQTLQLSDSRPWIVTDWELQVVYDPGGTLPRPQLAPGASFSDCWKGAREPSAAVVLPGPFEFVVTYIAPNAQWRTLVTRFHLDPTEIPS